MKTFFFYKEVVASDSYMWLEVITFDCGQKAHLLQPIKVIPGWLFKEKGCSVVPLHGLDGTFQKHASLQRWWFIPPSEASAADSTALCAQPLMVITRCCEGGRARTVFQNGMTPLQTLAALKIRGRINTKLLHSSGAPASRQKGEGRAGYRRNTQGITKQSG